MDSSDVEGCESCKYHQRKDREERSSYPEFAPNENHGGDARGEQEGDCTVLPNVLVTPGNDQHNGSPNTGGMTEEVCAKIAARVGVILDMAYKTVGPGR